MEQHKNAVGRIAAAVRHFHDSKEAFRIFHGSTNSTRPFRRDRVVDISALSNVLKVDTKTRTALVEPNVPMDRLVESTLKYGLVPPVVMEFPGITAGGGYAGTAGESSSFKHGFFDSTIDSVEMVLADGEVITASKLENSDLFHGAAGAVGSFGITTLIELQLIEAKKYVKTTYHPKGSVAETIRSICEETSNPINDYVDGILFSKNHGVVITGEMTNDKPEASIVQTFSHPADPWFYLHVKSNTFSKSSPIINYIPLAEYLFRYDRGGFWVGASAFQYFKFPFNEYTRWFLDDFLHTRMLYRALHASYESSRYIVQDLALPYSTAEAFIHYTDETFHIWPLWLCPLQQPPSPTLHPQTGEIDAKSRTPKPMLNIGLWGYGPSDHHAFVATNRQLEAKLQEFGGMKWLYAHTYYAEREFWELYPRAWYEALREKYRATALPSVYDKVRVDVEVERREISQSWARWLLSYRPLGGLWGIRKAIESGDYLVARNSSWRWKENERE
jgi:Delta24-sterol reductase